MWARWRDASALVRSGGPDWEDADTDGDGIDDSVEAGGDMLVSDPYDSDGDGTPD
ncbi:hypothetical protein [Sorangium sp. So ce1099]|uniref:hypothetical protein n=1 Tax=Sorangium sp. So ce1099 TaxID=3133331 RepID=UPI003F5EFCCC